MSNRFRFRMPTLGVLAFLTVSLAACFDAPLSDDEPLTEEVASPLTRDDCTALGERGRWPEDCPARVTKEWCGAQKWDEAKAWDPKLPICLGFGTEIDKCGGCNKLNLQGKPNKWSLGWNRAFIECAQNKWLPTQTAEKPNYCFVTKGSALTKPDSWPDKGQVTAREMCTLGVPTDEAVAACRKQAMCPAERAGDRALAAEHWIPDGMGGCTTCTDVVTLPGAQSCGDAAERFGSESECQQAVDAHEVCPLIPSETPEPLPTLPLPPLPEPVFPE
jgi:hypothetical protein